MKHMLMHPDFPNIVEAWAQSTSDEDDGIHANDNDGDYAGDLSDPMLDIIAVWENARTRVW